MAKFLKITLSILMMSVIIISCKKDSPVDEDGLLITFRQECFVSNFELLGSDFVTVRAATAVIDTVAQTINVTVNPEKALIVFKDNGIGIAQEFQEKIFKMFFRATPDSKGSGLGLT